MSEMVAASARDGAASEVDSVEEIGPAPKDWAPILVRAASVVFVFVAWELLGRQASPLFMSYPTAIVRAAWDMTVSGELGSAAWASVRILTIGFIVGTTIAIGLGLLIGRYKYVEATVDWAVLALYATPQVALIPLIILWMGLGDGPKLFIVITHAFFPVIINTSAGVRNVSKQMIDVGDAFAANEQQIFKKVILPSSLPYIMAGVRLAVGRSIIGMVVAEFFTSITGLGALIVKFANQYDMASMFVPILLLMVMGVSTTAAAGKLERWIAPWKATARS